MKNFIDFIKQPKVAIKILALIVIIALYFVFMLSLPPEIQEQIGKSVESKMKVINKFFIDYGLILSVIFLAVGGAIIAFGGTLKKAFKYFGTGILLHLLHSWLNFIDQPETNGQIQKVEKINGLLLEHFKFVDKYGHWISLGFIAVGLLMFRTAKDDKKEKRNAKFLIIASTSMLALCLYLKQLG